MKKTALAFAIAFALLGCKSSLERPDRRETAAVQPKGPAPDFDLENVAGGKTKAADLRGKVSIVDFWATWCEPCYVEIPWLIEMQQKYAAKGFTVLGVSMDEDGKGAVVPFLTKERFTVNGQKLPMNYPIVLGNDEIADKFGGLLGYPTGFLISRDGKVVKKFQGLTSFDDIAKAIEAQL